MDAVQINMLNWRERKRVTQTF